MYSNTNFRINLIQKTCNYICYSYVASFLHVLNVIIIPANFAIKDLIMFFKSNWISKSTLYLSQVVWALRKKELISYFKSLLTKLTGCKGYQNFRNEPLYLDLQVPCATTWLQSCYNPKTSQKVPKIVKIA